MADLAAHEQAIARGALVRAMPSLGTLVVTGDDRQSWLAGMVTADLAPLRAGQGAYALAVNKNGRIQAELWVALDAAQILIGVEAEQLEPLREHMDKYLIMEDAEIAPADAKQSWWLAHGPSAEAVVRVAREHGAVASLARLGEIATAIVIAPEDPMFSEALLTAPGALLATPEGWECCRASASTST
jgi:folate-binding Fe-S cluster repair protein YgfZ